MTTCCDRVSEEDILKNEKKILIKSFFCDLYNCIVKVSSGSAQFVEKYNCDIYDDNWKCD